MPDWSEILGELEQSRKANKGRPDFDGIRRKYLAQLAVLTGRATILYASQFTSPLPPGAGQQLVWISDDDLTGLMTVTHGLEGTSLDLILHSPGGSAEAAEALVAYLRSRFSDVRVIVPQLAMSAATMVACSADRILMGKHSFLGPIDPQMVLNSPFGPMMVPAEAILEQFKRAKEECQDPAKLGAWIPMLSQYGPALLVQCEHARDLARALVATWL